MPDLSILICTITTRKAFLDRLLGVLMPQVEAVGDRVELLIDCDEGQVSIGAKRQRLLEASTGAWVSWTDDDDMLEPDHIASVLKALESKPDAVAVRMRRYHDGVYAGDQIHSMKYAEYKSKRLRPSTLREFYRCINHFCPVRRELALKVGFKDWNVAEDSDYAYRLRPFLKSEVQIKHPTHIYLYRSPDQRDGEMTNALRSSE